MSWPSAAYHGLAYPNTVTQGGLSFGESGNASTPPALEICRVFYSAFPLVLGMSRVGAQRAAAAGKRSSSRGTGGSDQ
jgi:hypothetical protein